MDILTDATIESTRARYERPLIQYVLGLTSGDLDLARDIVQDTFLRLLREASPLSATPWGRGCFPFAATGRMIIIANRNALFIWKKNALKDLPAETAAPSSALEEKENALELARFLERLPKNLREVIRLNFQRDLSYKEIADITSLRHEHLVS